jgi:hypothetical protein
MNATPKTHAVQVRRAAEARTAVVADVRRLAFTSETGVVRPQRPHTEHVMSEVEADLAGGVTIGYCECGEYMRFEGQ